MPLFLLLLLFCIPAFFVGYGIGPWLGSAMVIGTGVLFVIWRRDSKRRVRELMRYMDTLSLQFDTASQNAVFSIPLPMAVARMDTGELI